MKKDILKKDIDRLKKKAPWKRKNVSSGQWNATSRESRFKRTYSLSSNEKTPV